MPKTESAAIQARRVEIRLRVRATATLFNTAKLLVGIALVGINNGITPRLETQALISKHGVERLTQNDALDAHTTSMPERSANIKSGISVIRCNIYVFIRFKMLYSGCRTYNPRFIHAAASL